MDPKLSDYVVAVDAWGRPLDPGKGLKLYGQDVPAGKPRGGIEEFDAQLDGIFTSIQTWQDAGGKNPDGTPKRKKLLIFVHGGMTSSESALQRAEGDYSKILAADSYPIYINWNSEPFSSYGEHLFGIRHGQPQTTAWISSPFYLFADLGRAVSRAPVVWSKMLFHETFLCNAAIRGEFLKDQNRRFTDDADEGQVVVVTNHLHELEMHPPTTRPTIDVKFGDFVGKGGFTVLESVQYTALYPSRFLLTPLLDGLGKPAWDNMCRRTSVLFDGETANAPQDVVIDPAKFVNPGDGPVERFRTRLQKYQEDHPGLEITLVGHSMGAIVLDELVRRSTGRIFYSNIVYLAAASSVRDFQRCVVPYLFSQVKTTTGPKTQFYNLCLHPVNDLRERVYYDFVPRGSLLVWIDDFLSEPATPLDRTMGRWDNIVQAVYAIPPQIFGQIHFKAFSFEEDDALFQAQPPLPGMLQQNPQMHGEFTEAEYWNPDLWTSPPPKGDQDAWQLIATRAKEIYTKANRPSPSPSNTAATRPAP